LTKKPLDFKVNLGLDTAAAITPPRRTRVQYKVGDYVQTRESGIVKISLLLNNDPRFPGADFIGDYCEGQHDAYQESDIVGPSIRQFWEMQMEAD
jgi:hypothetical protein